MNTAIEIVIFKAKADVLDRQLQTAALAITPILEEMPGFISREFGASVDGRYIDIVHWQDLPAAQAAAEKVMGIPTCGEFFGLIDQNNMQFMHFTKIA